MILAVAELVPHFIIISGSTNLSLHKEKICIATVHSFWMQIELQWYSIVIYSLSHMSSSVPSHFVKCKCESLFTHRSFWHFIYIDLTPHMNKFIVHMFSIVLLCLQCYRPPVSVTRFFLPSATPHTPKTNARLLIQIKYLGRQSPIVTPICISWVLQSLQGGRAEEKGKRRCNLWHHLSLFHTLCWLRSQFRDICPRYGAPEVTPQGFWFILDLIRFTPLILSPVILRQYSLVTWLLEHYLSD